MGKIIQYGCIIILLMVLGCPTVLAAEKVEINYLIENAKSLDGKNVTIEGEIIGEPMKRGENSWVNITDGSNAIGLWMDNDSADSLKYYGDYKHLGDKVKVEGIFYRACGMHDGEADIHVLNIVTIETGHVVVEQIATYKILVAFLMVVIATLLGAWLYDKVKILNLNFKINPFR